MGTQAFTRNLQPRTFEIPLILHSDAVVMPPDAHRAVGLTFHLADLYLPEVKILASAAVESGVKAEKAAIPGPALRLLLSPFTHLLESTLDQHVLTRVK